MKTKKQTEFKNRQMNIWEKEQDLNQATVQLMIDLIASMDDEELEAANEVSIEFEDETTVVCFGNGGVEVEQSDGQTYIMVFDEFSQGELKIMIDSILLNVFKI
jgi:hypothetical protein